MRNDKDEFKDNPENYFPNEMSLKKIKQTLLDGISAVLSFSSSLTNK